MAFECDFQKEKLQQAAVLFPSPLRTGRRLSLWHRVCAGRCRAKPSRGSAVSPCRLRSVLLHGRVDGGCSEISKHDFRGNVDAYLVMLAYLWNPVTYKLGDWLIRTIWLKIMKLVLVLLYHWALTLRLRNYINILVAYYKPLTFAILRLFLINGENSTFYTLNVKVTCASVNGEFWLKH